VDQQSTTTDPVTGETKRPVAPAPSGHVGGCAIVQSRNLALRP